jgi:dihydroxyacetone kinase-like predicted kinase
VLNYATSLGSLRQISIANMQDQHEEFLEMHAQETGGGAPQAQPGASSANGAGRTDGPAIATGKIAVLAVASGSGLVNAFKSMGATAIIEGGQSMNPSTEDILRQVESVPQNEVIILPNNGNIIMSARQSATLTKKHVVVVPTDTVPQGMSALIALNFEASLEENLAAMEDAAHGVQTGELTRAVRDAKVGAIEVKAGEVIGLLNNTLVATGDDLDKVAWDLLERMGASERELVTIYWGGDLGKADAQDFSTKVQERYPNAAVELVQGGQPFYDYIMSAE